MKNTMIMLVLLALTGCKGISNGAEIRELWEACEAKVKGGCSVIVMPNSIPQDELNKLVNQYVVLEESK